MELGGLSGILCRHQLIGGQLILDILTSLFKSNSFLYTTLYNIIYEATSKYVFTFEKKS